MKSVLAGFLGTFTSRYSDFQGYWLHGQLLSIGLNFEFDLLGPATDEFTPEAAARRHAVRRFLEQLAKHRIELPFVQSACLKIEAAPHLVRMPQSEVWARSFSGWVDGHWVEFTASAIMKNGRRYEISQTIFVAPHDPQKEWRRAESGWGN